MKLGSIRHELALQIRKTKNSAVKTFSLCKGIVFIWKCGQRAGQMG